MNDYLSKPVNPHEMAKTLERWLPQHEFPVEELTTETETENGNAFDSSSGRKKTRAYDREAMLKRTMGDEIMAHKIVEAFITELPGMIDTLITSVSKGDIVSAERMAHTIQGSAASVSCDTIHEIALKMKKAGREGLLSEIEAMIPDMKDELEKVKKTVKEDNQ
jgi:HPt (histidine-containing phosphotransfer) domain-containing protein